MLGTANVPRPVNIAPGTDGPSTGTKKPLGMPVAFLMSIGSYKIKKKKTYIKFKGLLIRFTHDLTVLVLLLGQFLIQ